MPSEAFKKFVADVENAGNRAEESPWSLSPEEIEELYAEADADADYEDGDDGDDYDDDDDDDYDHDTVFVSGPFDLSHEVCRTYYFWKDGQSVPVAVEFPLEFRISEHGDHLITTEDNTIGIVIPCGWIYYEIVAEDGLHPFGLAE